MYVRGSARPSGGPQGQPRRARDAGVTVEDITTQTVATIPMGRMIESRDLANTVLYFCSPLADIVTGQAIAVDGGSGEAINY